MSHIDPVDLAANFSTGGLYGVGKGAEKAITQGKVGAGAADALASYGTFGSIAQPTLGTANTLKAEGLIAGGALGAAGPGAFSTSGFGAAAGGAGTAGYGAGAGAVSPYYFGFDPDTLAAAGTGEFGQFAGGVPAAGMVGGAAPALASGSFAADQAGALLGASAAQQATKFMPGPGGASPLSMPTGGAASGAAGGLTPQQLAALSAQQSEAHRGLAPRFEQRQAGSKESPGIASMSQYYGGQ